MNRVRVSLSAHIFKFLAAVACLPVLTLANEPNSDADNPPVPAVSEAWTASDESVRVALVDSGVNYLLPEIHQALARTSDGDLVGYDYWDLDNRPFDAHPTASGVVQRHGTQTASLLLREAPFVKLVPYRYPRPDMRRMAELIAHANDNGVQIIGMPLGGNRRDEWDVFESAADSYPHILFIASAGNNGRNIDENPVFPASLSLPNLLVVTSSDDFVQPAQGVNWGRTHVDYLVPAEMQRVLRFDGSEGVVSGSSYAVPRVAALAARILRDDADLDATDLQAEIRRRFASGAAPRQIGKGYVHDPRLDTEHTVRISSISNWSAASESELSRTLRVPLDVLVLDEQWSVEQVRKTLDEAQSILQQCGLLFSEVQIRLLELPDYLKDLETGASKTVMDAVRLSGPARRLTAVFARDSQMNQPFDAEAFGKGNTRSRSWLTDSVWLTLALRDRGIGLAHELFHVLRNSGSHSEVAGNLMLARTTGTNRALSQSQCKSLQASALQNGLAEAN